MSWSWLIDHWELVELDLHQLLGVDLADHDAMSRRTWPWLVRRVAGLLSVRSRTLWALHSDVQRDKLATAMGQGANPIPWL